MNMQNVKYTKYIYMNRLSMIYFSINLLVIGAHIAEKIQNTFESLTY